MYCLSQRILISALQVVLPATPLARLVQELEHRSAPRAPSEPNWCSEPVRPSNAIPATYLNGNNCDPCSSTCQTVRLLHRTVSAAPYWKISFWIDLQQLRQLPASPATDQLPPTARSCPVGFQLSGSQCIQSFCARRTVHEQVASVLPCHSTCLTCNAGALNNCQSCPTGFQLSAGACVPIVCASNQYLNGNDCLNCNPSLCDLPRTISKRLPQLSFRFYPQEWVLRKELSRWPIH
jgi:hypothetical protein